MRQHRVQNILLASAAYAIIGVATAALAQHASSPLGVKEWRLAAWLLSAVVFAVQIALERGRIGRRMSVALDVALGAAIGAFLLAAFGPVRAHWAEPSRLRLAVLSLLAWPLLVGVPAFVVALLAGSVLDRAFARPQQPRSDVA